MDIKIRFKINEIGNILERKKKIKNMRNNDRN